VGERWRLSNKSMLPVTGKHSENKVLFLLFQNKEKDERTQPEQRHSHYLILCPYNKRSVSTLLPVTPACLSSFTPIFLNLTPFFSISCLSSFCLYHILFAS